MVQEGGYCGGGGGGAQAGVVLLLLVLSPCMAIISIAIPDVVLVFVVFFVFIIHIPLLLRRTRDKHHKPILIFVPVCATTTATATSNLNREFYVQREPDAFDSFDCRDT